MNAAKARVAARNGTGNQVARWYQAIEIAAEKADDKMTSIYVAIGDEDKPLENKALNEKIVK